MRLDEAAAADEFDAFVATHGAALARLARGLTADRSAGEDVLQTALMRVWRHWPRVRAAEDPELYVRRIVINAARSTFRRPSSPEAVLSERPNDGGIGAVPDRLALVDALRKLPPKQRAVIVLRYLEDLSERQIAQLLRCSEGTVKSHTSRALAALRMNDELTSSVTKEAGR